MTVAQTYKFIDILSSSAGIGIPINEVQGQIEEITNIFYNFNQSNEHRLKDYMR
jgi:hypothetical protein